MIKVMKKIAQVDIPIILAFSYLTCSNLYRTQFSAFILQLRSNFKSEEKNLNISLTAGVMLARYIYFHSIPGLMYVLDFYFLGIFLFSFFGKKCCEMAIIAHDSFRLSWDRKGY